MDAEQVGDSQLCSAAEGCTVEKSQKAASLLDSAHLNGCNRGVEPSGTVLAKVTIRERWVPGLGPAGDDVFDIDPRWRQ
jgi:hypothetical protein